jgi:hypothetical protein
MEIGSEVSRGLDILKSIKKPENVGKVEESKPDPPKIAQKKKFTKKMKNFAKERQSSLPEPILEAKGDQSKHR